MTMKRSEHEENTNNNNRIINTIKKKKNKMMRTREQVGCVHHLEHQHDHDEECSCGCGHHHHHHADEVFTSWGKETAHKYTEEELDYLLKALSETDAYGTILRSKGIIQMTDGNWKQFDLVPQEYEVRDGNADYAGRMVVIGTDLKEDELAKLFHVQ